MNILIIFEFLHILSRCNGSVASSAKISAQRLQNKTILASSYPCALWTRYNNDDAPSFNGFSAGISHLSNTTIYVGMGMLEGERFPARIQITNSTIGPEPKTPGGYVPWKNETRITCVEYLVVPDGCSCSWLSPSLAANDSGLIFTGDLGNKLAIGRKTFSDGRVGLTKVVTLTKSSLYMQQSYNPTISSETVGEPATELLVCKSKISRVHRPEVNLPSESCGMWSSIGMQFSASNSFNAGLSIVNNTAFIGRGQFYDTFSPGRYQVENPTGTYIAFNKSERIVDYGSQWLIIPQNCSCKWMNPDHGRIKKGLIAVPDGFQDFMIGYKIFLNGQKISITRVQNLVNGDPTMIQNYANADRREIKDYATEILVCETDHESLNACALWTRYNFDNAPLINGFLAGISHLSNTTAYVGMGSNCDQYAPAIIQIVNNTIGNNTWTPSGYVLWSSEVQVDFPEYLVVPDGCKCFWMTPSIASGRTGLILTGDLNYKYAVGRKIYQDGRVQITKVMTNSKLSEYMKQWQDKTAIHEPATELLVCETNESTSGQPKVTLPTESCGMWSSIGMISSAATNGFSAGLSIKANATDQIIAYVGRGPKGSEFLPGRYQVEEPHGTYVPYEGVEMFTENYSQWLIVSEGCTCRWVHPDQGQARNALVTTPDKNHNYMIGRKLLSDGKVSISRVDKKAYDNPPLTELYVKEDGKEIKDLATEVLICETMTNQQQLNACALWARYNNDDAPSVNSFSAGISHISNTTVFVGFGIYHYQHKPARIQIVQSTIGTDPKTPGGYISYSNEFQVPYVEYLVLPYGCKCSWMTPSIASSRPGLIVTGDSWHNYGIGRKTLADGRVTITKIVTVVKEGGYLNQWYNPTSTTEVCNEPATEMLVCETTVLTSNPPKIKFKSEACGMWSSIGMINAAPSNGFSAGLSIVSTDTDNHTAYVARGIMDSHLTVARYQKTGAIGTHASFFSNERKVELSMQWLIVPHNCSCRWMTPDQAKIRKGLITVPNQDFNFMIGRKTFPNGLVSVSRVNNVLGQNGSDVTWEWYANLNRAEETGYATELLVCENLPAPLNACALWTRYNYDDAPSINGFSAGISYLSNTAAYVGMGMYGKWRQPARIDITPGSQAGGYTIWSKEVKVNYPEYLVVPNGCKCSWMSPSIASNRAIVLTGDPEIRFAVGRKVFEDGRVAISKVITFARNPDYMLQWYNPTSTTEVTNETATELLVCESTITGRPKVNLTSESCGMWSTIGMVSSTALNGFSAGTSIANNTAFIGRGQMNNRFIPGRYQIESPTGTFASFNDTEMLVDYGSQWLIVPQNCSCSWISPDQVKDRKSLITVPDQLHNFMVGRKNLSNNLVSVSRVNFKNSDLHLYQQWYANMAGKESSDIASEVLVCTTT